MCSFQIVPDFSTMSSNLNALAAVIYKEVVCLFLKEEQSEARATFILKIIVVLVGILGTCLIFVVERLGEIISIMSLVFGIAQGPLLGLFTLGMVVPRANSKVSQYFVCLETHIFLRVLSLVLSVVLCLYCV